MLHLFSCAINPPLRLGTALRHWLRIAQALGERPRRRQKQMKHLCTLIRLS